jgi:NAD(P)-dependent dehydrogenase (short-subunit alcohol dehydrogenase family)
MLRTGGGVIVNTSSTAGLTGQQNISPYTFAKAGIIGLTRSAAIEYAGRNIRVNAIAPTVVWTPRVERFAQTAPDPAAIGAVAAAPARSEPEHHPRWTWPRGQGSGRAAESLAGGNP